MTCGLFAPGVLVRVAIIVCLFLALRSSLWAAVDPHHFTVLPVFLWVGAACPWVAVLPVLRRYEVAAD